MDCVYSLLTYNYESEYITLTKIDKAAVYSRAEMNWSLDGEYADGAEKTEIENLRRAVKIIL
jgi:diacylglycerol kinase family enzyme